MTKDEAIALATDWIKEDLNHTYLKTKESAKKYADMMSVLTNSPWEPRFEMGYFGTEPSGHYNWWIKETPGSQS